MQKNINIQRPGEIRQMEQNRRRIKNAGLNISEKRSAKTVERIPERDKTFFKTLGGKTPHRKIKVPDVAPDEAHPLKNDLMKNESKN